MPTLILSYCLVNNCFMQMPLMKIMLCVCVSSVHAPAKAGINQLAAAFPYPVTSVPIQRGLHLKSFLSMAGKDLIAIGNTTAASDVRMVIEETGHFKYDYLEVPDNTGANCLYLNDTLVHASREAYPDSCAVFEKLETNAKKIALSATEMNKVDGCFTCCSVLIK